MTALEAVIGLEVHVQLDTATKIFCGCSTRFGSPPNTHVCPVCTGQPGALPMLNQTVVEYALRVALACGCSIRSRSRFARKNYFYPDLPKGYQISQFEQPLAEHGEVEIWPEAGTSGKKRVIRLTRIHVEEDAGKSMHVGSHSRVDLNRAGVPLIEIVSEPDIRAPEEAAEYMRTLRGIVRTLKVSDGNMEQGSLRCDANISLREVGSDTFGVKTEVKNINSFRFVQKALEFEIVRQRDLLDAGQPVVQETRLWDSDAGVTTSMRSKEEAHDYRYFPDPDLPPLALEPGQIESIRAELPELPNTRRATYIEQHGLSDADARFITAEPELDSYLTATINAGAPPKRAASWLMTELLSRADPRDLSTAPTPERLAGLLALWEQERISGTLAKQIWPKMWGSDDSAEAIVERENLYQQSDVAMLEAEVKRVIDGNPKQVEQYRAGKHKVLGFFVGQVMRATKGKANPQTVNELVRQHLEP